LVFHLQIDADLDIAYRYLDPTFQSDADTCGSGSATLLPLGGSGSATLLPLGGSGSAIPHCTVLNVFNWLCFNVGTRLAMSNQRSFKIRSFRFAAFVPKRIERFKIKILDQNKTFSVSSQNFLTKSFCFVRFQNFFNYLNVLFCLWKTLAQFVRFWFRFDIIF
jgi:hypothetical protein